MDGQTGIENNEMLFFLFVNPSSLFPRLLISTKDDHKNGIFNGRIGHDDNHQYIEQLIAIFFFFIYRTIHWR